MKIAFQHAIQPTPTPAMTCSFKELYLNWKNTNAITPSKFTWRVRRLKSRRINVTWAYKGFTRIHFALKDFPYTQGDLYLNVQGSVVSLDQYHWVVKMEELSFFRLEYKNPLLPFHIDKLVYVLVDRWIDLDMCIV